MLDFLSRMMPRKKQRNNAVIAGAMSLAALSGALITWYTARRMRHRDNDQFFNNEESQP